VTLKPGDRRVVYAPDAVWRRQPAHRRQNFQPVTVRSVDRPEKPVIEFDDRSLRSGHATGYWLIRRDRLLDPANPT
jgi:hypothetical protein